MEELAAVLRERIQGEVRLAEPMKKHTSFRIGGPADIFVLPQTVNDIQAVLELARRWELPFFILGRGSNLLVRDQGIRGLVLKIASGLNHLQIVGNRIEAGAGVSLPYLARTACQEGLRGLEFIAGIPGTLGGAVVMNAGAAGHSLDEVITKVKVMEFSGEIRELTAAELDFGYRRSRLQKENWIVLEAELELEKGNSEEIRQTMTNLLEKRKKSQPLSFPNAGSIFKNPDSDLGPAGKLIDLVGAKGKRIGDAQVSELHANFIVNLGNAQACQVLELMGEIQEMVRERFGVFLEPEVKIVGG